MKTIEKLLIIFILIFSFASSCSSDDDENSNCTNEINNLSTIYLEKTNAFAENNTISNCEAFRTAYINLYNKMNQCGLSTSSIEDDYDYVQNLDCSNFSGGSGGGNGVQTGNLTVWTSVPNFLTITVTCAGQTKYITNTYNSIPSNCGALGCANFSLPVGQHLVQFTASNGASGSETINITNNVCYRLRVTN